MKKTKSLATFKLQLKADLFTHTATINLVNYVQHPFLRYKLIYGTNANRLIIIIVITDFNGEMIRAKLIILVNNQYLTFQALVASQLLVSSWLM